LLFVDILKFNDINEKGESWAKGQIVFSGAMIIYESQRGKNNKRRAGQSGQDRGEIRQFLINLI